MSIVDDVSLQANQELDEIRAELIGIERRILIMRIASYAIMFMAGALTGALVVAVTVKYH